MIAPLPHTASASIATTRSWSKIKVENIRNQSRLVECESQSPVKILNPNPVGHCAQIILSSYGGGNVQNDHWGLKMDFGPDIHCYVGSQASAKAYRMEPGLSSSQHIESSLGSGAVVAVLPDVFIPQAESHFSQEQHWNLDSEASLVLLDWHSLGRSDAGEKYAFRQYQSKIRILRNGRPLFLDAYSMRPQGQNYSGINFGIAPLGEFCIYACLVIALPAVKTNQNQEKVGISNSAKIYQEIEKLVLQMASTLSSTELRNNSGLPKIKRDLVVGCSQVEKGLFVIRALAKNVSAMLPLFNTLKELNQLILGCDPWERKF